MWGKKNLAGPLAAAPEPKNAVTKMKSTDAMCVHWLRRGPHKWVARVKPACERRHFRHRGSADRRRD